MRWRIEEISRKSSGDILRRGRVAEGEVLYLGRGSGCSLHLPDPRVLLHHATLLSDRQGVSVRAEPGADLLVNGALVSSAQLKLGDRIQVGPYTLEIETTGDAGEVQVCFEMTRPPADVGAIQRALVQRARERVGLSMRQWSWILALCVFVAVLALPIGAYYASKLDTDTLRSSLSAAGIAASEPVVRQVHTWLEGQDGIWTSGPISSAHRAFAGDCQSCHVDAFVQVQDETCTTCHSAVNHHFDPDRYQFEAADAACQSCHKEHNGLSAIARRDQAFCADCHGAFAARAPQSSLKPASDFGDAHPDFRPTVVTHPIGPVTERIALSAAPVERSGLKFAHTDHLNPEGVRHPEKGRVALACRDCHVPEPGGAGMQPIAFDSHCASCHRMAFEPERPQRRLPHGDPAAALATVRSTYALIALEGGFDGGGAEDAPAVIRRRPGTEIDDDQRAQALRWARERSATVITGELGKGLCRDCHTVTEPDSAQSWEVVPVELVDRWLPKGRFDHDSHRDQACTDCHEAPKSKRAEDVLLPDIDSCRSCHGGAHATTKVPSTCVDCHGFHQDEMPGMAPVAQSQRAK